MGLFRRRRATPGPSEGGEHPRVHATGVDLEQMRARMGAQLVLVSAQVAAEAERRRALPTYLIRLNNGILITQPLDEGDLERLEDNDEIDEIVRLANASLVDYQGQHLVVMLNAIGLSSQ